MMEMKVLEILMAQYKMRKQEQDKLIDDIGEAIDNIVQLVPIVPERVEKFLKVIGLECIIEKKKLLLNHKK